MGERTINKVVKIVGEIYFVEKNGKICECSCLKKHKKDRVIVGDNVEIVENNFATNKFVISKVFPRKNSIPRPNIANIDKLLILVAPQPKPDFYLLDKLIIYSIINNIEPIIVVNKVDIAEESFVKDIQSQYSHYKVLAISTKTWQGIDLLKDIMRGCLCAVCGQSAVGKSSLINVLIPDACMQTQGLSEKISRGKHTTRVNEIFVNGDIIVADTPGFSSLDIDIDYRKLSSYYPEFADFLDDCKYLDCSHIKEGKDCGVVLAKEKGQINIDRYNRYVDLYQKLKEKWDKKYD